MASGGSSDDADRGNDPRQIHQTLEIVGRATVALQGVADAMACAVQNENQGHAFVPCQLREAIALVRSAQADGPPHDGEVLGAHQHGSTPDASHACGKRIRGDSFALGAHQGPQLLKTSLVEERFDAFSGVELTSAPLFLEFFTSPHGPGVFTTLLKIGE